MLRSFHESKSLVRHFCVELALSARPPALGSVGASIEFGRLARWCGQSTDGVEVEAKEGVGTNFVQDRAELVVERDKEGVGSVDDKVGVGGGVRSGGDSRGGDDGGGGGDGGGGDGGVTGATAGAAGAIAGTIGESRAIDRRIDAIVSTAEFGAEVGVRIVLEGAAVVEGKGAESFPRWNINVVAPTEVIDAQVNGFDGRNVSIFVSDSFLSRTKHVMLQYRHLRLVKLAFFPVFMKNGDAPGSLTRSLRVTSPLWTKTACLAVKGHST